MDFLGFGCRHFSHCLSVCPSENELQSYSFENSLLESLVVVRDPKRNKKFSLKQRFNQFFETVVLGGNEWITFSLFKRTFWGS